MFAMAQMVFDFSEQFVWMEAENAQLRKELTATKIAASQIEHSQKVAEEAWQANEDLKKELAQVKADLKNEVGAEGDDEGAGGEAQSPTAQIRRVPTWYAAAYFCCFC